MKTALIISTAAHTVLLGLCVFSSSSLMLFNLVNRESLPVSLVPLGDEMVLLKGNLKAIKTEKLLPTPTEKSREKLDAAEHTGKGKIDTKLPFMPKEKPREIKAVLPSSSTSVAGSNTPLWEESIASEVDQKEIDSMPEVPQKRMAAAIKLKTNEKKKMHSLVKKDFIDNILAMNQNLLIDKTKTQNDSAKRDTELLSSEKAENIKSAALQQILENVIGKCVQSQWDLAAVSGSTAYDLRVIVHFRLNRDGTLNGEPELNPAGGSSAQRDIIAIQALAALRKCIPFSLPIEKYNQWHNVTINMKVFPE